jgi:hypothetical protein
MKRHVMNRPIAGQPRAERRVPRALAALFALALAPACGSEDPGRSDATIEAPCPDGSTPKEECPTASEKPDSAALIDDLEDADSFIPTADGARSGAWWTAADETPGATIVPPPLDLALPEAIVGGRCDSKLAMRVTGQGFLDWGSLLGVNLVYGKGANGTDGSLPYDASAYSGIEFWARIGDTSTDRVRFAVSDVNSEPDGGVCTDDPASTDQCYDTFGAYLNGLTPAWRHYRIPFTSLLQRNFGHPAAAAATSALYSVQFNFDPGSVFDFWVDDLAFY